MNNGTPLSSSDSKIASKIKKHFVKIAMPRLTKK